MGLFSGVTRALATRRKRKLLEHLLGQRHSGSNLASNLDYENLAKEYLSMVGLDPEKMTCRYNSYGKKIVKDKA